jgi:hypothetical protein
MMPLTRVGPMMQRSVALAARKVVGSSKTRKRRNPPGRQSASVRIGNEEGVEDFKSRLAIRMEAWVTKMWPREVNARNAPVTVNPWLGTKVCDRLWRRFCVGVQQVGIASRKPIVYRLGFHGTGEAASILRNGFDPSKRHEQVYGTGEYFDTGLSEAICFARNLAGRPNNSAGIIATSIVEGCHQDHSHSILVVDNPVLHAQVATYCFPFAFIPVPGGPDRISRADSPWKRN